MDYKKYIKEALPKPKVIEPSAEPGTITMWHGGNLDDYEDSVTHRSGRNVYGAGSYLINRYDVAAGYAKGSRKLYQVVVKKGNEVSTVDIDWNSCLNLLKTYGIKSRLKEHLQRFDRHIENGKIPADVFNNIILNEELISPKNLQYLRSFLVESGADYEITTYKGYPMLVLFNMKKIVSVTRVMPNDKIVKFDLPGRFNE